MKIKQAVLDQINNVESRRRIAMALEVSDQMFYRHMTQNAEDGTLTKIKALVAISEETGLAVQELLDTKIPPIRFYIKNAKR